MTARQKLLKAVYPALMWFTKITRTKIDTLSNTGTEPPFSFYNLSALLNDGKTLDFRTLKGKKVLLVNTASDCGYTGQYEGLEQLYRQYQHKLVVLGMPANDFKEQEKGSDEAIASFCKVNYGVTFPLLKKSSVVSGPGQHAVFQWLTNKNMNGWNSQAPTWNFCKYLVDEQGKLVEFFGSSVEPLGNEMIKALSR